MTLRLGLRSCYSLLYGVRKPAELLDRALRYGVQTFAICDQNNIYGVHSFLEEAKERQIRPIIGAALCKEEKEKGGGGEKGKNTELGAVRGEQAVYCFVENRTGFGRLCEILTERGKDKEHFNPLPLLKENSSGLVLASSSAIMLQELAGQVKRLYAAITADELGGIEAHRTLSLPLAFLDTSVFLEKSDYAAHRVLRAIGLNKTIGNLSPGDTLAEGSCIFRPGEALQSRLDSWPEALRGSARIAELCQFNTLFSGFIFPSYGESPGTELQRRVYEGAALRYGELGDSEIERIEYELGIIEKMGFSPYFLRMDDIVRMAGEINNPAARTNLRFGGASNPSPRMNSPMGGGTKSERAPCRVNRTCGRGSGAASIVSYSLGITNVDPISHNLYFERFLNPARPDPPDIDVDFAWDERDGLINAVIERFGKDYCARVANHNFFRPRSALRETAKAYGFSDGEISRKLGNRNEEFEAGNGAPGTKDQPKDRLWNEIFGIAKRIEGLPRDLSMHCGGLVITPEPISRYAPVEKSAEGFPLLAWEKEGAEAAGFVKIDLLGNRSLAVIRDTLINLEEWGIEIDPYTWRPMEDRETIEALSRGNSMGVFYIESPAMRQLQIKTGKGDFEHIVIHSSIIRPAANKFIAEYVRRLKGGAWEPLHPRLESILSETYGILCYQEDVSKTAVALAGFNEADADKLRKVIAKKAGAAKLAIYEEQFFSGCRKNGVPEETIAKIWAMMLSFDGYSFCKPHSASYAMVSFQSAYLRVHHPAEFMAAVLSNQGGFYRPGAYISECRRMGIITSGPDINVSRWRYYGRSNAEGRITETEGRDEKPHIGGKKGFYRGTVIIGLMAIKGLSASGAETIIKERERNGDFLSLEDFSRRTRPARDDIIALCPAGAFDSIAGGLSREMQARRLLAAGDGRRNGKKGMMNGELFETHLFPARKESIIPHSPSLVPRSFTSHSLWEEYRALGFLRRVHPLALWKDEILPLKRIKAAYMAGYTGRYVKIVGWPVTQKEVWTKDGLAMSFLSFEDETALYETVIFPEIYERYHKLLFDQRPLLVSGRVVNEEGAFTLEIHKVEVIEIKS